MIKNQTQATVLNEVNDYDEFEGMPDQEVRNDSLASSGTNHK